MTGERLSLGINANIANARGPEGVSGVQGPNSQAQPEKRSQGLSRVIQPYSGVEPGKLTGTDLQVYKRALRWKRLHTVQGLIHGQRVEKCFRVRYRQNTEIWRSQASKRAHYKNLVVCASVWSCPVCAAKITERRKIEIETAPRINDFSKFMVTFTLQHNRGDRLEKLYADLCDGLRDMKNSRGYKSLVRDLQIVGTITGTEITVSGLNGWHPHKHALMFSKLPQNQLDIKSIRNELSELFIAAMKKRGRYVHAEIGVNVQGENVIVAYVAKMGEGEKESHWSLAAEIAKSPVKTGRDVDHFHPFELLDLHAAGNIQAGQLFKEYTHAMKRKKQLQYTKGLRGLLGLDSEITDQEIAEQIEKDSVLFSLIFDEHWKIILQHEKRGQLLEVASAGSYELFLAYLRALGCNTSGYNA